MLYSFLGTTPKEIPFRIILSDGRSRTDPTTFTPEEIADAGYVAAPDKPADVVFNDTIWNGSSWDQVDNRTFAIAKSDKLEDLRTMREYQETQLVFAGMPIFLDKANQARMSAALAGFEYEPNATVPWEVSYGVYVDFNASTMQAIAMAAWNHIRLCYENSRSLTITINAATTIAEIDAIDLMINWP